MKEANQKFYISDKKYRVNFRMPEIKPYEVPDANRANYDIEMGWVLPGGNRDVDDQRKEEEALLDQQKKEGADVDVADVASDVAAGTEPHRSIAGMKRGILGKIRKTNEEMVKLFFFIYTFTRVSTQSP